MEKALTETYRKISLKDQEQLHHQWGWIPALHTPVRERFRIGTETELGNLIIHVQKGCLCNPFSMDEITVRLDDAPYPDSMRCRGTSQGESTNRLLYLLVGAVGMQSTDLADKKL
jgi:hypothetical protein